MLMLQYLVRIKAWVTPFFSDLFPQSVQLQMKAPSGDVIPAQGAGHVIQTVLLNNPNKVSIFISFTACVFFRLS